jgi:hypothetical protein
VAADDEPARRGGDRAEGIEPDYVRQLVAARGLPPDEERPSDAWPWPLRIYALGRFEVLRDGAPLAFRGKAQKKPLELLKTLVALGGEAVDASRLAAILWPDAAGDAAKVSFDSTLYRLRKLLGLGLGISQTDELSSGDWNDQEGSPRVVRELDLERITAELLDDGAHLTAREPVLRQVFGQRHHVQRFESVTQCSSSRRRLV